MKVYWTSVEFDIVNPEDYENCIGGFVYLFLKARDVQDAVPKIQESIGEEGLTIDTIEFVSPYDETPWDTKEDQIQYDALAEEAQNSGEVVWDQISAYEIKDE
ncbi:MAG: hypothetical protein KAH09_03480 [Desulfobacula sp.]|nr:hypothetical protein [Desulfobacula sp.]